MAYTLKLDANWDLMLDDNGNIATARDGYAIAQNVANAVRLFTKDAYFDQNRGIPHFDIELGHYPPVSVLRSQIIKAAKMVEGVASATVQFTSFDERALNGEITIKMTDGGTANVAL